ncbi:unnamed protein product [Vitrella brassicaformis CCMP3155]|uniref:Uncharacterized protein n=1 Tax=Vitrella brassicaformis (strain CCMP3155) TaxID=1169540 RepID=A0A0G4GSW2_VITBC|nr:unnamed protein product [Vitrella brassicaformis CCMP3155]|eukprot:CEM33771.1 unnamed protein product [Vitrella brassicaformis CCMP3155]
MAGMHNSIKPYPTQLPPTHTLPQPTAKLIAAFTFPKRAAKLAGCWTDRQGTWPSGHLGSEDLLSAFQAVGVRGDSGEEGRRCRRTSAVRQCFRSCGVFCGAANVVRHADKVRVIIASHEAQRLVLFAALFRKVLCSPDTLLVYNAEQVIGDGVMDVEKAVQHTINMHDDVAAIKSKDCQKMIEVEHLVLCVDAAGVKKMTPDGLRRFISGEAFGSHRRLRNHVEKRLVFLAGALKGPLADTDKEVLESCSSIKGVPDAFGAILFPASVDLEPLATRRARDALFAHLREEKDNRTILLGRWGGLLEEECVLLMLEDRSLIFPRNIQLDPIALENGRFSYQYGLCLPQLYEFGSSRSDFAKVGTDDVRAIANLFKHPQTTILVVPAPSVVTDVSVSVLYSQVRGCGIPVHATVVRLSDLDTVDTSLEAFRDKQLAFLNRHYPDEPDYVLERADERVADQRRQLYLSLWWGSRPPTVDGITAWLDTGDDAPGKGQNFQIFSYHIDNLTESLTALNRMTEAEYGRCGVEESPEAMVIDEVDLEDQPPHFFKALRIPTALSSSAVRKAIVLLRGPARALQIYRQVEQTVAAVDQLGSAYQEYKQTKGPHHVMQENLSALRTSTTTLLSTARKSTYALTPHLCTTRILPLHQTYANYANAPPAYGIFEWSTYKAEVGWGKSISKGLRRRAVRERFHRANEVNDVHVERVQPYPHQNMLVITFSRGGYIDGTLLGGGVMHLKVQPQRIQLDTQDSNGGTRRSYSAALRPNNWEGALTMAERELKEAQKEQSAAAGADDSSAGKGASFSPLLTTQIILMLEQLALTCPDEADSTVAAAEEPAGEDDAVRRKQAASKRQQEGEAYCSLTAHVTDVEVWGPDLKAIKLEVENQKDARKQSGSSGQSEGQKEEREQSGSSGQSGSSTSRSASRDSQVALEAAPGGVDEDKLAIQQTLQDDCQARGGVGPGDSDGAAEAEETGKPSASAAAAGKERGREGGAAVTHVSQPSSIGGWLACVLCLPPPAAASGSGEWSVRDDDGLPPLEEV